MTSVPLRRAAFAVPALVLAASVAATSGAAAKPKPTYYVYGGTTYGSTAKVGTTVNSGMTSRVTMCSTQPATHTDHAAGVDLGQVGTIGAVTTKIQGKKSGSTQTSVSTSSTAGVNLLGGLVQATAITSTATVTHDKTGYHKTGSSKLVGLRIAGVPIDASVPKNTVVQLPLGLGRVLLNTQSTSARYGSYAATTQALDVRLNATQALGLGSGRVLVGNAHAELHSPVHTRPYGNAYASQINLLNKTVSSGATAPALLPCGGSTGGKTITNSTAAVAVGDLVRTGVVSDTAKSTDSSTSSTAVTTSKVAGISLLGGEIKVKALTTQASAVRSGSKLTRSSAGTKITGVVIGGRTIAVSGKENQKISVPGIATVYLHRAIRSGSQIQVYGLQVTLLSDSNGGQAGSVITVGAAKAGVATR